MRARLAHVASYRGPIIAAIGQNPDFNSLKRATALGRPNPCDQGPVLADNRPTCQPNQPRPRPAGKGKIAPFAVSARLSATGHQKTAFSDALP